MLLHSHYVVALALNTHFFLKGSHIYTFSRIRTQFSFSHTECSVQNGLIKHKTTCWQIVRIRLKAFTFEQVCIRTKMSMLSRSIILQGSLAGTSLLSLKRR